MADRYWVNDDADNDWEVANNWSASDGGAGGAGIPTSSDDVYFTASDVSNCTLSANAVCASLPAPTGYTGQLDFNDFDFHCYGDFTWNTQAGNIRSGTGTLTVDGNWYLHCTTFYREGGKWVLTGSGKTAVSREDPLGDVDITGTYTSTRFDAADACVFTVKAGATFTSSGFELYQLKIESTGTLTLSGTGTILDAITQWDGTLTNTGMIDFYYPALVPVPAANKDFGNKVRLRCGGSNATVQFPNNTYSADYWELASTGGTLTIGNNVSNPSFVARKDVDFTPASGSITWTKGSGTFTLSGANDQNIDFNSLAIEDIIINKTAGNLVLTNDFTTDSFTGTSTGTGDFDPNGKTITVVGNCSWAAAFDFDAAADCLNGCKFDIGGNFTADGQTLNATAAWYLEVDGTAVASGTGDVEYCDASGFTEIDASAGPWTDSGNNSNWNFGAAGGGSKLVDGGLIAGRLVVGRLAA